MEHWWSRSSLSCIYCEAGTCDSQSFWPSRQHETPPRVPGPLQGDYHSKPESVHWSHSAMQCIVLHQMRLINLHHTHIAGTPIHTQSARESTTNIRQLQSIEDSACTRLKPSTALSRNHNCTSPALQHQQTSLTASLSHPKSFTRSRTTSVWP